MSRVVSNLLSSISTQLKSKHAKISPTYSYNLFNGAQKKDEKAYNRFHVGLCVNPHQDKRDKGGEDAATVSESFIALADGVGGWSDSGVDPAKYSRSLCKNIQGLIICDKNERYMCNPKLLCQDAANMTKETGSSTCVIASMDKEEPVIYTSNLGDSGYLLLRKSG